MQTSLLIVVDVMGYSQGTPSTCQCVVMCELLAGRLHVSRNGMHAGYVKFMPVRRHS